MIFLDIETVPNKELLSSPSWEKKKKNALKYDRILTDEDACLNPVFGKTIAFCGTQYDYKANDPLEGESLNIINDDEEEMLEEVSDFLLDYSSDNLVAHNGKDFDFPYLIKRFMHYGIKIPPQLKIIDKKPWEVMLIDTMDMLRFNAWGVKTSLDEACLLLGIESPKDTFDSSSVWEQWKKGNEEYILKGCMGDVVALHKVYKKIITLVM